MSKRKPKEADKKISSPEMDKQAIDVEENQEAEEEPPLTAAGLEFRRNTAAGCGLPQEVR